jgi:acyl-CoA thioesterase II
VLRPTETGATDFARWWRDALTVRPLGGDVYSAGPAPSAFPRLYGGQVAAQSLLAAAATVEDGTRPHSLHTMFLRGGDPAGPVHYRVERVRDSRTLATRLVHAEQDARLLAVATASFHRAPPTVRHPVEHEIGVDAPVAPPESLPTRPERLAATFGADVPRGAAEDWPVDVRYVGRTPWDQPAGLDGTVPRGRLWLRAAGPLGDGAALHAAALTFATDWHMFEPVLYPHRIGWAEMISGRSLYGTSLDHTLWFHRAVRLDEWVLLDQVAPVAGESRGFCRAEVRGSDGRLAATVAQEVCFVEPRQDGAPG